MWPNLVSTVWVPIRCHIRTTQKLWDLTLRDGVRHVWQQFAWVTATTNSNFFQNFLRKGKGGIHANEKQRKIDEPVFFPAQTPWNQSFPLLVSSGPFPNRSRTYWRHKWLETGPNAGEQPRGPHHHNFKQQLWVIDIQKIEESLGNWKCLRNRQLLG